MKQHSVQTENFIHHFQSTVNIGDIAPGATQIWGCGETITEFVQNLELETQWIPYGYCLRKILTCTGSNYMTAYLYKLGEVC